MSEDSAYHRGLGHEPHDPRLAPAGHPPQAGPGTPPRPRGTFDAAALVDPALAASADPAVQADYAAQVDKNVRKAGQFREVLALALT